jgi:hypothetical protein
VLVELTERRIYVIRGQKAMLDSDLAEPDRVETKALNRAVRRNIGRFPEDFLFQLTGEEAESLGVPDWRLKRRTRRPAPPAH